MSTKGPSKNILLSSMISSKFSCKSVFPKPKSVNDISKTSSAPISDIVPLYGERDNKKPYAAN